MGNCNTKRNTSNKIKNKINDEKIVENIVENKTIEKSGDNVLPRSDEKIVENKTIEGSGDNVLPRSIWDIAKNEVKSINEAMDLVKIISMSDFYHLELEICSPEKFRNESGYGEQYLVLNRLNEFVCMLKIYQFDISSVFQNLLPENVTDRVYINLTCPWINSEIIKTDIYPNFMLSDVVAEKRLECIRRMKVCKLSLYDFSIKAKRKLYFKNYFEDLDNPPLICFDDQLLSKSGNLLFSNEFKYLKNLKIKIHDFVLKDLSAIFIEYNILTPDLYRYIVEYLI